MFKHILIPVDDDAGSRRAILRGVDLACRLGARVTGVHVATRLAHPGIVDELLEPPPEELIALARADAERLFEPLHQRASRAGVACDTFVEHDTHAYTAILAVARRAQCDLIVMASHRRRGLARLVLGSQTLQVLQRGDLAVLVVR